MKKVLTVALLAAFCAMAFGAVMVVAEDGMLTIDQPKEKFPKAKLDKKTGEKKKPQTIDPEECIKCGVCRDVCRFEAVTVQ